MSTTSSERNETSERQGTERVKPLGRRLFGQVKLRQDWDEEAEEGDPGYWELFTDLLMVAAASGMADSFKDDQTWFGFLEFALLYSSIALGWLLYTHHYTSRFLETSLLHSCNLFFYLLGMAASIVSTSFETARQFSFAVVLQRVAFLAMVVQVYVFIPRARWFAGVLGTVVTLTIALYLATALSASTDKKDEEKEGTESVNRITLYFWCTAAIIDYCVEIIMMLFLKGRRLVPVNIDHSKDRLAVLVLVMMGETVISATISYREQVEKGLTEQENRELYEVLAFSFLLVFMFTMLYFHVQPREADHAFRRSRLAGMSCMILNKTLGLTLLLVGVCIKVAVEAVAEDEKLKPFSRNLLNYAVGGSMMLLFGTRCCHYLGRMPRESHPLHVKRLLYVWWVLLFVGSLAPFFFPQFDGRPVPPLILHSFWLFFLCVMESYFTHVLEEHMFLQPQEEEAATPLQSSTAGVATSFYDPTSNAHKGRDMVIGAKATEVARETTPLVAAPPTTTDDAYVLLLVSLQSFDRSVVRNQQEAKTLLDANKIKYQTVDGSDPAQKEQRNKLFAVDGATRAKYPQFFIVRGDTTTFWGGWDQFESANERHDIASEFATALGK